MTYGNLNVDTVTTSTTGGVLGAGNASIMKNRIINGAMVIDQRNAGASVTPANAQYTLDRWFFSLSQASKLTCQQNAGSVTPPVGFTNYLGVTSSSAYTVGSSELFLLRQAIEGFNVADLGWGTANAKTVTLSFQVYSSLTGTFGGSIFNSASNRFYPYSYSVPVANTWTTINITIAGDTSGTWLTTNGIGINVSFSLGAGATVSGTAGSWGSTTYWSATGATSVVGTSGATFYITGVQLEVGSSATGYEYVNYTSLLSKCYRYYVRYFPTAGGTLTKNGIGGVAAATDGQLCFATGAMRTVPTGSFGGSPQIYDFSVNPTITSITAIGISANMVTIDYTASGGGLTVGRACNLRMTNAPTDYVDFSAEL